MRYIPNAMISTISMKLNEMSLVENLSDRLSKYISENKFNIYAIGRAGNYFGVSTGAFVSENKEFSSLKECILYILRENKNLVFRVDGEKYIPGYYFNDNLEVSTYMENNNINNYFDIDKGETVTL